MLLQGHQLHELVKNVATCTQIWDTCLVLWLADGIFDIHVIE